MNVIPEELPTLLDGWCRNPAKMPDDDLIYRNAGLDQVLFARDVLPGAIYRSNAERGENPARVIGEHRSKSVLLPVYYFRAPYGVEYVLRENFYFWNVSVLSERMVPTYGLETLFNLRLTDYCFFEGFPHEWKFGPYVDDPRRFSFYTPGNHRLWTALYLIRVGLGR